MSAERNTFSVLPLIIINSKRFSHISAMWEIFRIFAENKEDMTQITYEHCQLQAQMLGKSI